MAGKAKYSANLETFGGRVREARMNKGMSQEQLAEMCGYGSRATINCIELGKRDVPLKKAKAIASALNIDVSYLVYGIKSDEAKPQDNDFISPEVEDMLIEMTPAQRDGAFELIKAYYNALGLNKNDEEN